MLNVYGHMRAPSHHPSFLSNCAARFLKKVICASCIVPGCCAQVALCKLLHASALCTSCSAQVLCASCAGARHQGHHRVRLLAGVLGRGEKLDLPHSSLCVTSQIRRREAGQRVWELYGQYHIIPRVFQETCLPETKGRHAASVQALCACALCKLVCASCSAPVAPCKRFAHVLCAGCSAQVTLRKLLCASAAGAVGMYFADYFCT